jgi:hypothetical protein
MQKDLNINGIVYAKYEIENNILFYKVLINDNTRPIINDIDEHDWLIIQAIKLIEDTTIESVAHLNI